MIRCPRCDGNSSPDDFCKLNEAGVQLATETVDFRPQQCGPTLFHKRNRPEEALLYDDMATLSFGVRIWIVRPLGSGDKKKQRNKSRTCPLMHEKDFAAPKC